MKHPFVLCGHDFEGETREIGCASLERAKALAVELTTGENSWQDFEIWGNHPQTENWEVLASGDSAQTKLDK